MTKIVIAETPIPAARGFYTANADPNQEKVSMGNGPVWRHDFQPGGYIFTCAYAGAVGTDVTVVIATDDDDHSVLATKTKTIADNDTGKQSADSINVRFTVLEEAAFAAAPPKKPNWKAIALLRGALIRAINGRQAPGGDQ